MMDRPSRTLLLIALAALAIGIVEPFAEVAWKCRTGFETSEACVWGRSYLPLGRVAGLVIVAPVAFGVMFLIRWAWAARVTRSQS